MGKRKEKEIYLETGSNNFFGTNNGCHAVKLKPLAVFQEMETVLSLCCYLKTSRKLDCLGVSVLKGFLGMDRPACQQLSPVFLFVLT